MTDALSPQQQSIIQIVIRFGAISKGLACMEYERNIQPEFFLALLEEKKRFDIIDKRLQDILVTNKIKSYIG